MVTVNAAHGRRPSATTASSRDNVDSTTVDLAVGTRFSIVPGSAIATPPPTRLIGFSSSITGITNFLILETLHPPFRVNLSGIIGEVSDVRTTSSSPPKCLRTVEVLDVNGCKVVLRQMGSAVEDVEVQRQRHVSAYFISGGAERKSGDGGSLWAFEDSYLKIGSMASSVPDFVKDIALHPV